MNLNNSTDFLQKKRILITGAAGFVGSNLLNYFLSQGIGVNIIVRPTTNLWRIPKHPLVNIHYADLTDYNQTLAVLNLTQPQIIFHIASTGGHPLNIHKFLQFHSDNTAITTNLLEASIIFGVEKFIHCGSSLEGEVLSNRVFENYSFKPTTYRGITKATESMLCNYYVQVHNLNLINIRIFSAYGFFENSSRVIPQLILRFLKKESISLASDEFKRDFVFIEDVIHCITIACCTEGIQSGTIINIGNGVTYSPRDIYKYLEQIFGYQVAINTDPFPRKTIDTTPFSADLSNIREALNWFPEHSIELGLSKTVKWFKNNLALYE